MTIDPAALYPEAREPETGGPLPVPARALAVGAHPDDVEFGCGATLAAWAAAGCEVTILVMTDGSKGSWDPAADPRELAAARRAEQQAAADALGATRVVMLDHVDGELEHTRALTADLCRRIRELRPEVLISHDPWRRYELHPDHRATGWAVVDGVVAARDHLFFPEQLVGGLAAHRPAALLLWRPDEPDHREDVAEFLEAKLAALLCHSSQAETTMGDATADEQARAAFRARIVEWAARAGAPAGLAAAEEFKLIRP